MKKTLHRAGLLLVVCISTQLVLADPVDLQLQNMLKTEIPAFLSAASPQARTGIATRVASAIIRQPQSDRITPDLAQWTGALLGASGEDAPTVAAALLKAGGTNYAHVVRAAVSLAAPVANATERLRQETLEAVAIGQESVAQGDASAPAAGFEAELNHTVLEAAKFFTTLRNNWDPARSLPAKDIFADRDGGEPPCPRGQERNGSQQQSERKCN